LPGSQSKTIENRPSLIKILIEYVYNILITEHFLEIQKNRRTQLRQKQNLRILVALKQMESFGSLMTGRHGVCRPHNMHAITHIYIKLFINFLILL